MTFQALRLCTLLGSQSEGERVSTGGGRWLWNGLTGIPSFRAGSLRENTRRLVLWIGNRAGARGIW